MFEAMSSWSGIAEYYQTTRQVYRFDGQVAGYVKSVRNLRQFVMRNTGHIVPKYQPEHAQAMFFDFIEGAL